MENIFESWLVKQPIAHRGLHDEASPENSLTAFEKAVQHGYTIELDIHVLMDNVVVVFHDDNLKRMTGFYGTMQNLKYDDIKPLFLGNSKEKIPTLKEVLELVNGRVPIVVEIKNHKRKDITPIIWEELKEYTGEFAFISFNPFILGEMSNIAPHIMRGQLSSFFKEDKMNFLKKILLKRMAFNKISKPDFIDYNVENLPNRFVKKYKHLPLIAWTIRSKEQYLKTKDLYDNCTFQDFII